VHKLELKDRGGRGWCCNLGEAGEEAVRGRKRERVVANSQKGPKKRGWGGGRKKAEVMGKEGGAPSKGQGLNKGKIEINEKQKTKFLNHKQERKLAEKSGLQPTR